MANFQQWQSSIDDLKKNAGQKALTDVIYSINEKEFTVTFPDSQESFTAQLEVTEEEFNLVKEFVKEATSARNKQQRENELRSFIASNEAYTKR